MNKTKMIVAVLLGLAAGGAHFSYVNTLEKKVTGGEAVSVLNLASDVQAGEKIVREMLATRLVPASYADSRAVTSNRTDEVIDLVTAVDLQKGQALLWTDFTVRKGDSAVDLADLLEPGKRAMTISVDRALSMGGLLRPGHRVDILGTFSEANSRFSRVTVTLLQNIPVLATGTEIRGAGRSEEEASQSKKSGGQKFGTVTLSVGLEQAELLSLSSRQGTLSVALRGHQDLEVVNGVPQVSMKDIWERDRKGTPEAATENLVRAIERIPVR